MYEQKANGKPTKKCPKPHNKLALSLQRWEAKMYYCGETDERDAKFSETR